eukprot:GFUD01093950.1.p2 GENE.GFUD01093950.1~~GFUD01093950.1.p2  ORF type:complete len:104 (-),score=24.21 GFUD01093950.1:140-412(-)
MVRLCHWGPKMVLIVTNMGEDIRGGQLMLNDSAQTKAKRSCAERKIQSSIRRNSSRPVKLSISDHCKGKSCPSTCVWEDEKTNSAGSQNM